MPGRDQRVVQLTVGELGVFVDVRQLGVEPLAAGGLVGGYSGQKSSCCSV
jgi:hypothetical protein